MCMKFIIMANRKNNDIRIMRTAFVLSLLHAATALPALPKDFSTKEHTMTGEDTTAIAARRYAAPAWAQTGLDNEACATFEGLVEALGLEKEMTANLSEEGEITMPEPKLAYINLTGISDIPSTNRKQKQAWMEMYDGEGRYFRKPILLRGQGGYTLRYPKRNFAADFCNAEWEEEDTPDFRIGDWVRQDGFHFKAFYTDFMRGLCEVGYKWYRQMIADRKSFWERGGYFNESEALCVPDGFPCIVYIEGKFWGVYAWQLKKHRRNMNMKKETAEQVHLDGNINDQNLFNGNVNWKQFEVRNPKQLYTQKGEVYDGNYPNELMDKHGTGLNNEKDSEEVQKGKERSAKVKQYIQNLSQYKKELTALEQQGKAVLKTELEKRFDVESLLDYLLFNRMLMNGDGTQKNWQWFTYDGVKWMVAPYDLDQTFGITLYGFSRPATHTLSSITTGPFPFISKYYAQEEADRYAELRQKRIFSEDMVLPIIHDWYGRVGTSWYEMEKKRWPESPCYCEAICNDGWKVCDDWSKYDSAPEYDEFHKYREGDICMLHGRLWEATKEVECVFPYVRNSDIDTLERLVGWISDRLDILDEYYGYKGSGTDISYPGKTSPSLQAEQVFTVDGKRIPHIRKGINIVRMANGTTRIVYQK